MVYHCFLDDSKDKEQTRLMASAGFFANKHDWGNFRLGWTRVLRAHGLEYFKSREYYSLNWGRKGILRKHRYDSLKASSLYEPLQDAKLIKEQGGRGVKQPTFIVPES